MQLSLRHRNTKEDGTPNPDGGFQDVQFTKDENGELVPTIIVRQGVTIMEGEEVVKKSDAIFAQDDGSSFEGAFGYYSPNAIKDERVFD